ncbi:hypothetical protein ASPZODRAFT_1320701 [Penicilliopsis zonata CBS 506.65]|uniref:Luciferase-like domain-containing protein n=1 Tax=Penicilliopsis zonata CBS 506.65 TaxID=1073090 RepID=A0A1L9SNG4_9EURO|nr:hypothetical protein ASPZODRAFT_1320701 [Penicilliopsis zonata CBS 506.65]OJJ48799.1 hypothetical protein ASPZODRAFT_1320701 [Penicilliopsis zonata CBS 506.65]
MANPEEPSRKKLIINAAVLMSPSGFSPGLWRNPADQSSRFDDLKFWVKLAQTLEAAKFHGIFIADALGGYEIYKGPHNLDPCILTGSQFPNIEPLSVISAMAAVTESLGFSVTVATTFEHPYHLARRLSTVDHLTQGRLGWNIVTGYLDSAARNFGLTKQVEHDQRYVIAEEYMQVMYKLLESSWRDDAVRNSPQSGIFTDPSCVREINHVGEHFNVPGPHICHPSPQRTPLLLQAGASKVGKAFAAQHAEVIFVSGPSPGAVASNIAETRQLAQEKFGRDPAHLKCVALVCPVLGRTEEEAQEKHREYVKQGSVDGALALFGGWTGIDLSKYGEDEELREVESNAIKSITEAWSKSFPGVKKWTKTALAHQIIVGGLCPTIIGTAEQVADELERWVELANLDGFNFSAAINPESFIDIAEMLLPELRRRGLFWDDYAVKGGTLRENSYAIPGQKGLPADHPGAQYHWKAGVEAADAPVSN